MNTIITIKEYMVRLLEIVLMVAIVVLVFDVLWGVTSRYVFGEQSNWTEELARVLLIWVVLLGGAIAFGSGDHLGVDYFVGKMDKFSRKKMKIIVDLVALSFTVFVLLVGGFTLVSETFRLEQMMMAIGISKAYVYLAVPISGVFFLIFGIESIIRTLFGPPDNDENEEILP